MQTTVKRTSFESNQTKLTSMLDWITSNPAKTEQTKQQQLELLKVLKEKITFEYDTRLSQVQKQKTQITKFYTLAKKRLKKLPKELANMPALNIIDEDFDVKDEIMFGKKNVEETILDKDYIEKCSNAIIKHQYGKKKGSKRKNLLIRSKIKRIDRKKLNRKNNVYPKSVTKQKKKNLDFRNPIVDKSLYRSKTPKYKKFKTTGKKKVNKNGLGRSLIKAKHASAFKY